MIQDGYGPLAADYYDEQDLKNLGVKVVGANVRVAKNSTLVGLSNIEFGSNVRIDSYTVVIASRGAMRIGSNVHIEPHVSVVAHYDVHIGDYCTLSHGVRFFTASADYSGKSLTNAFPSPEFQNPLEGGIVMHTHSIIGGNSVVMPGVTIGEGSAIGALSFVRHNLDGWHIYAGNPLRVLAQREKTVKKIFPTK